MTDAPDLCPNCKTEMVDAPSIGIYCPNRDCPVLDGWTLWPGQDGHPPKAEPARWRRLAAAAGRVANSSLVIVGLCLAIAYGNGYYQGLRHGTLYGVDLVMCTMDRIANSHPPGARGASDRCRRIDDARDARS